MEQIGTCGTEEVNNEQLNDGSDCVDLADIIWGYPGAGRRGMPSK